MIHFGKRRIPVVFFILIFPVNYLSAQKTHSDDNDDTYINPVIFADFPDRRQSRLSLTNSVPLKKGKIIYEEQQFGTKSVPFGKNPLELCKTT